MKISQMSQIKIGDSVTVNGMENAIKYKIVVVGPGPLLEVREKEGYLPPVH